ncbi:hypothetical protein FBD94_11835 [Pedobacter hiemivivus]|uniref:Uncharacterized protein n=1 Tax=Pedobacter hiemivivus TaxID=2530454 RepID=A0A4U1GBB2_9SPHI|nr:hypothetical protein [Pedobacter hiemivivus]TKC61231.1 hypothetical protein FBD94_11835 [Pedobacter hiemivivus]
MNWAISIYQHLKQRISKKFLLIFSLFGLSAGGIVWACSDYGFDYEYSSFSPEAFVSKEYTPFFYTEYISYYGDYYYSENNTSRYNDVIVNEWQSYFDGKLDKKSLQYLLTTATAKGVDSVYEHMKGKIAVLPNEMPQLKSLKLDKKKVNAFFDYLRLAKSTELFAATDVTHSWEPQPQITVPAELEEQILKHFKKAKDPFIKQRLWFQLVRYYYFIERGDETISADASKTLNTFNIYKNAFPQNMMYHRTLGYVAGWYYKNKDYARSNYLNSLCYNYSMEAKIPAEWSFHPQEEADWIRTLQMAKTTAEKATLWHLLGIHYDTQRAIQEIISLDSKSEKLDLLLARIVNITEHSLGNFYQSSPDSASLQTLKQNTTLISSIAFKNNTAKPYFWNLAAGYLNFMSKDYTAARSFYNTAKQQLPKDDKLVMAQYKILDWTLYVKELKNIDAKVEAQMIEPLTWFANLKDRKDTIPSLRFYKALDESISNLAELYKKQGDVVKANAFKSYYEFYADNNKIEQMKALLQKQHKSAFEQIMLRYYPFDMHDLYYHQSQVLTYQDKIDEAIVMMNKSESTGFIMPANPFNIRVNDCHDCDHERKPAKDLYAIDVLKTIQSIKAEIKQGKNVYKNAYLLANVFYNITFYGNSRTFYQGKVMQVEGNTPFEIPSTFRTMLLSNKIAEKYYLMAANVAKTKEQKARCIFMASKCERNESYNRSYNKPENANSGYWDVNIEPVFFGKYFSVLKTQYEDTKFYDEAIKECGYFRSYDDK